MRNHATIYEVAAEAGVSISTVSNALNRPERVSASTRDRVMQAVDKLQFTPTPQAVSQARRDLGRIAVVAPFSSYASFLQRLSGLLIEVRGEPYEISVIDIESAATSTSPEISASVIRGQHDGLIVMGEAIDDDVEQRLIDRRMPTVVVDADSRRFSVIATDDNQGGRLAAQHLLDLGHRRIGYLLEPQVADYDSQARRRLDGFRRELADRGVAAPVIGLSSSTIQSARDATRQLLDVPAAIRPTAIMAHYDDLALGAIRAARDLELAVPRDVSILGFDDGPSAEGAGLSTIRQPLNQSGALAFRVLRSMLRDPQRSRSVTFLDCELISRETTGPAPSECFTGNHSEVIGAPA